MATIQQALTIALDHHQAGRPAEAEILCRRILDADPDQATAWHLLGIIHAQAGLFDEAAALLGEALARAPGADLHRHRAMARQEAGDLEGAVADYREAARLAPALTDAALNAGILLERLGRHAEAREAYRTALTSDGASDSGAPRAATHLGR
ncbi:tetratricopeptide repeat protein, partial [Azospirillum brasilense]